MNNNNDLEEKYEEKQDNENSIIPDRPPKMPPSKLFLAIPTSQTLQLSYYQQPLKHNKQDVPLKNTREIQITIPISRILRWDTVDQLSSRVSIELLTELLETHCFKKKYTSVTAIIPDTLLNEMLMVKIDALFIEKNTLISSYQQLTNTEEDFIRQKLKLQKKIFTQNKEKLSEQEKKLILEEENKAIQEKSSIAAKITLIIHETATAPQSEAIKLKIEINIKTNNKVIKLEEFYDQCDTLKRLSEYTKTLPKYTNNNDNNQITFESKQSNSHNQLPPLLPSQASPSLEPKTSENNNTETDHEDSIQDQFAAALADDNQDSQNQVPSGSTTPTMSRYKTQPQAQFNSEFQPEAVPQPNQRCAIL